MKKHRQSGSDTFPKRNGNAGPLSRPIHESGSTPLADREKLSEVETRADAGSGDAPDGEISEVEMNRDPFCRGVGHTSARGSLDFPLVGVDELLEMAAAVFDSETSTQ